jgi:diguanylate cyclase (GGDEF)-like protein
MIKMITFEDLSLKVDGTQRKILSTIWQHYLDKKQWPLTRRIHHDFGKPIVQSALNKLGGTVVREILDSGSYRYQLNFLGLLLTEQGAVIEQLLIQYLKFLQKRFDQDPEREMITSDDVLSDFDLTAQSLAPDQITLLGKVIHLSFFLSGAGTSGLGWTAGYPSDIDEWAADTDFRAYIRRKAMDLYNPALLVDDRGRALHFSGRLESTKEREQKFKIMFSPDQAKQDFDKWSEELKPSNHPIAIAFVDIDNFKPLNTRYGHPQIDKTILPEAQQLLLELVRNRGEGYRYGGDEFLLILPNHTALEASAFAERVRSTFEQQPFRIGEEKINLTVSIGISIFPEGGADFDHVLQKASEANGEAKLTRNTVKVASVKTDDATGMSSPRVAEVLQRKAAEESKRRALKRAKSYSVS